MSLCRLVCTVAVLGYVLSWTSQAAVPSSAAKSPESLLAAAKTAAGGALWDSIQQIDAEGHKTSFGLTGNFHLTDQLSTGFFLHRTSYSIFSNAEGFDREGRWRQDNSGQVHPLNSAEAVAVALSESYIARHGFYFLDRVPVILGMCDRRFETAHVCISVTPHGGRTIDVWIDTSTGLIDRVDMKLSVGSESIAFNDYRLTDGLSLPFRITTEHGDESETGVATIDSYSISRTAAVAELSRPTVSFADTIVAGANVATAHGFLDHDTGFFILEAGINGSEPYPFILDTGGHNILIPGACRELKLSVIGNGFSNGAGAASTPEQFTKVSALEIGRATIRDQPFAVLHIDLGTVKRPKGRSVPIAGILGLELFERFAITLDASSQTFTLTPHRSFSTKGHGVAIPLHFTSDMPLVPATIDGYAGLFALDTGNNIDPILFHTWAVAKGLHPESASDDMQGTSVGGDLKLAKGHITRFLLGDVDLGPRDVLFSSDTAGSLSATFEAGNLGASILSGFIPTFDYSAGVLYLEATSMKPANGP